MHLMRGLLKHPVNELPETMIVRFVWCIVRSAVALSSIFVMSVCATCELLAVPGVSPSLGAWGDGAGHGDDFG